MVCPRAGRGAWRKGEGMVRAPVTSMPLLRVAQNAHAPSVAKDNAFRWSI
jgi:hypothetical protein